MLVPRRKGAPPPFEQLPLTRLRRNLWNTPPFLVPITFFLLAYFLVPKRRIGGLGTKNFTKDLTQPQSGSRRNFHDVLFI